MNVVLANIDKQAMRRMYVLHAQSIPRTGSDKGTSSYGGMDAKSGPL